MRNQADHFRIVCLGGSAGGLEAYIEVLRSLPADSGMAFVVAPHRGVQHADLLPRILSVVTGMPVAEVTRGMRLQPNCVYIMPPGKEMTIADGAFDLSTKSQARGWPKTISTFLLSLAEAYGSRAVAVILSGMDHDGSAALRAVKSAGGVTFAQSNPTFSSMPDSAIETGYVDFILPPAEIAEALMQLPERA